MEGVINALALLARDGIALPAPADGASADPAWRAALTVLAGVLGDAAGRPVDRQALDAAWQALIGEHRDTLASLLTNLSRTLGPRSHALEVHDRVLAAMPDAGLDALVWSIEHPDQVRSLTRLDLGLRYHLIALLARLGDARAADSLRRLVDEPDVGEAAARAVRAIEERMVRSG